MYFLHLFKTLEVANAMKNKQWVEAIKLRGNSFMRNLKTYRLLNKPMIAKKNDDSKRLAVIQISEPSPGINAAVFAFVRFVMSEGNTVFGVYDGIDGLIAGNVKQLKWSDVGGWTSRGGALLGTSDTLPDKQMTQIVDKFKEFKIDGLLVIGGFKAFETVIQLIEARNKFNELKIPICIIPATINNNIPGTDLSLGTDSALNKITQLLTDIIFSTLGLNNWILFY
jgi:6-phosphofructokinase 1